jgi:hypothetical protein
MHPTLPQELAAQRIAELHRQAAHQRLVHELRAGRRETTRPWTVWARLLLRQPHPARA